MNPRYFVSSLWTFGPVLRTGHWELCAAQLYHVPSWRRAPLEAKGMNCAEDGKRSMRTY